MRIWGLKMLNTFAHLLWSLFWETGILSLLCPTGPYRNFHSGMYSINQCTHFFPLDRGPPWGRDLVYFIFILPPQPYSSSEISVELAKGGSNKYLRLANPFTFLDLLDSDLSEWTSYHELLAELTFL